MAEHENDEARTASPRRWLEPPAGGASDAAAPEGASPEARRLLAAARPYRVPVGRRQRVWRAIEAHPQRWRSRQGRTKLVVVAAVVLVLAGVATARAHWLGGLIADAYRALFVASAAPHEGPTRHALVGTASGEAIGASSTPRASPVAEPASEVSPAAKGAGVETSLVPGARDAKVRASAKQATVRHSRALPDEMGPLLEAARAIRVAREPARARALLAPYLTGHAHGAFAEEALALSIEAAALAGDADAGALAARYLARYPAGPFQETARRVRDGALSSPR